MIKRRNRFVFLLMGFFLIVCIGYINVHGFPADEHDNRMWKVLTGMKNPVFKDKEIKKVLESASYLCIDQCNNKGKDALERVKKYGVKGIVEDISEINYNAMGDYHRENTHSGWNYKATPVFKERWEKRKDILRKTVGKIFDFEGNTNKLEAFCKLIYYIHIIGDYEYNDPFENDGLLSLGGEYGGDSVISELLDCIDDLFDEQHYSYYYLFLRLDLELVDARLFRLYNTNKNLNNILREEKYYKYIDDLEQYLNVFIPKLLKNEKFFSDVYDFE